jgi:hypothetical protein
LNHIPQHSERIQANPVRGAGRRKSASRERPGLAIQIRLHDRAIVPLEITHIGPVDVPGGDIEH